MTKEELAGECYQIVGALAGELEIALEATDGYISAHVKENIIRVLDGLNAIANEEDEPESLLPFDVE